MLILIKIQQMKNSKKYKNENKNHQTIFLTKIISVNILPYTCSVVIFIYIIFLKEKITAMILNLGRVWEEKHGVAGDLEPCGALSKCTHG